MIRFFDLGEYMKYMTEDREGLYKENIGTSWITRS